MLNKEQLFNIKHVAQVIRNDIYTRYNGQMMGKCIEASDTIVAYLRQYRITCEAKQVWVLYEYFENCMSCCYEEHWLVEIRHSKNKYYLDVTMDQFQSQFSKKLPEIYFSEKLPNFYLTRKITPNSKVLNICGWNDWYETGNYENNFNYWD